MTDRWRSKLEVVAIMLMISSSFAVGWAVIVKAHVHTPEPTYGSTGSEGRRVPLAGAQFIGRNDVSRLMVVYSDFQCPYCAEFATKVWPTVKTRFVDMGTLRVAFHNYPIERRHPKAFAEAVAAACAGREGKFWSMHDRLFAPTLTSVDAAAGEIGLFGPAFHTCISADDVTASIRSEVNDAVLLGINATPTFVFGEMASDGTLHSTALINGYLPLPDFIKVVERFVQGQAKQ
jgi:protein-disulfide isomerase